MTLNGVLQPVGAFSFGFQQTTFLTARTDLRDFWHRHVDRPSFHDVAIRDAPENGVDHGSVLKFYSNIRMSTYQITIMMFV